MATPLIVPGLNPSDSEFRYLLESPKLEEERQFIENLWNKYEPYADKQFRLEIAINFHKRFWEMYLTCALIAQQRYELIPKTKKKGPDICLKVNNAKVWIEAVAPGSGEGPDAIVQPKLESGQIQWFTPPEENIILRYLTAIFTKHNGYKTYLEDVVGKDESYIIAVNGRRVPFSNTDTDDDVPYIIKAVLPFGIFKIDVNFETNEIVDQRYTYRSEITKANNSTVSTHSFLDKECSGISGILFSNADLLNRPQISGSEFIFIHNPLADSRLPRGWLPIGYEYWVDNGKLHKKNWNK